MKLRKTPEEPIRGLPNPPRNSQPTTENDEPKPDADQQPRTKTLELGNIEDLARLVRDADRGKR